MPYAAAGSTTALVGGYRLTWIGFGVVAYAAAGLSALLAADAPDLAPWVCAGLLTAAGVYKVTPLKDFCLRHCRSPMAFLLRVGTFDNQAVNGSMGICTCREKAEQFIAGDRFVLEGLAVPGEIREWNVLIFCAQDAS